MKIKRQRTPDVHKAFGRSISEDGKICDTLWKRVRKHKQFRAGVWNPSAPMTSSAKPSAVPAFVRAAVQSWLQKQGRR